MIGTDEITAVTRKLRMIWLALLLSVAALNMVVWFLLRSQRAPAVDIDSSVLVVGAVLVLSPLMLSPIVRRRIETPPRDATARQIVQRWQAGWIVGQAMKEAVGLGGLVLALLAGSTTWAWGFAGASLLSMFMTPPWEREVRARVQRATGSPFLEP